jgi:iron complex transport system substrate-binding protein
MNKLMRSILIMTAILAVGIVSGCARNEKVTVTDSRGTEIAVAQVPKRIVSMVPSTTEVIYALGAGDSVIAVSKYCNYPPEADSKPEVATGKETNVEAIVGMKPDAVFMTKMGQTDDQIGQLEGAGIKVFVFDSKTIADVYMQIETTGKILGKTSEAAKIVADMKSTFEEVKAMTKDLPKKTAYVEVSPLKYGIWTTGKNTFMDELMTISNIENVFAAVEGWKEVSEEEVIAKNPDFILSTVSENYGVDDTVADIKSRKNWKNVKAVKDGNVFKVDTDLVTRPGPRLADAAKELVKLVYGK